MGTQGNRGEPGAPGAPGAPGDPGAPGAPGVVDPSISAVTPTMGYLGRTIDLVVSGNGTAWVDGTTVAFSNSDIKVNSVLAASQTGLLVNVTIPPGAALGASDVMVTDAAGTETYKGAFKVMSPLEADVEPAGGLLQGGVAVLHVRMLDTTTPFDATTAQVALGSADVAMVGYANIEDFRMDLMVESDVLAATGGVDLTVTSGAGAKAITSPLAGAFQVAARAPTALKSDMPLSSQLMGPGDSLLYSYAPASATTHFVEVATTSIDGGPLSTIVPKSGKLSDALGTFTYRFGMGTNSTDPLYLLVSDGQLAAPPPYGVDVFLSDTPCTAMTEVGGNIDPSTAEAVGALPALVSGDIIDGMAQSPDWFKVGVMGATAMNPKSIRLSTGGDGLSDVIAEVFDIDAITQLGYTEPLDRHKGVVVSDIMVDGTYYVRVSPGFGFDASHSTYELFVSVQ